MLISMYLPMFVFCYRIILTTYKLCNVRLNKTKHFRYLGIVYWSQLGLFLSLKQQDIALSSRRYKYSALHINHCFYLIFSMDQKWLLVLKASSILQHLSKTFDSIMKKMDFWRKIFHSRRVDFLKKCTKLTTSLWENCFWHIFYSPSAARNS